MIFGSYPCCDGDLCIEMPDKTPAYFPEECPHCGSKVWHRLSRIQTISWIEEEFLKEFDVDEVNKIIKPKPGSEAEAFDKCNVELLQAVQVEFITQIDEMFRTIHGIDHPTKH